MHVRDKSLVISLPSSAKQQREMGSRIAAHGEWRMIECGCQNADDKIKMENQDDKCGWKMANYNMRMIKSLWWC